MQKLQEVSRTMKTLVVYTSQTGFTKRYAGWIAEKTQADLFDLKDVQGKDAAFFEAYDALVYAGWCMAGKVVKANWFLDRAVHLKGKKLAVVAVGASPNESPDVAVAMKHILSDEQQQYIKLFYCQGGIDYDKMKLSSKLVMKMFASSLKKSKDEKRREMGLFVDHSYDISDIRYIEPLVTFLAEGN